MSRARLTLLLAAPVLLACAAAQATSAEQAAQERYAALALGVTPFDVRAAPGASVPDVAALLGARLESRGVGRVVARLDAAAELPDETVQQWASAERLDAVVVGRTTRIGDILSFDVRVRRPEDGSVAETFVAEATTPAAVGAAVAALGDRVLGATLALCQAAAQAPGQEPAGGSAPAAAGPGAGAPFGFSAAAGPLSIQSDELEADDRGGQRKIVFRSNVVARQGDLTVSCQQLEAHYPKGSKQPNRLFARGKVQLRQGEQRAWCDEAEFDRAGNKLFCRGNGRFRDGDNELRGDEIEIDLAKESVQVRGAARFFVKDDGPASPAEVAP